MPDTPARFGEALRALRKVSLSDLVQAQAAAKKRNGGGIVISKSQLARYEGGALPPLRHAEHLDGLYQARGWLSLALRNLWGPRWDPWGTHDGPLARHHHLIWPARLEGHVWIRLKPRSDSVDAHHRVTLQWGAWCRDVDCALPAAGVVLVTGKAEDERSVTLNLSADREVFVLYGAGESFPPEDIVLNIEHGWKECQRNSRRSGEAGAVPGPASVPKREATP
ncbi:hypothetical protein [Sinomonas soli]